MPVTDNSSAGRFELDKEGLTTFANYRLADGTLYIDHVEAPPALRGTGAAGELMQGVMQIAGERGYRVVPICGYAAAWIRRHQ